MLEQYFYTGFILRYGLNDMKEEMFTHPNPMLDVCKLCS